MPKVKLRYENGVLVPLERLDLREGEEIEIDWAITNIFRLMEETSSRVAATGIGEEELEELILEAVREVRQTGPGKAS